MISVHSQADDHSPLFFKVSSEAPEQFESASVFHLRNILRGFGLVTVRILFDRQRGSSRI